MTRRLALSLFGPRPCETCGTAIVGEPKPSGGWDAVAPGCCAPCGAFVEDDRARHAPGPVVCPQCTVELVSARVGRSPAQLAAGAVVTNFMGILAILHLTRVVHIYRWGLLMIAGCIWAGHAARSMGSVYIPLKPHEQVRRRSRIGLALATAVYVSAIGASIYLATLELSRERLWPWVALLVLSVAIASMGTYASQRAWPPSYASIVRGDGRDESSAAQTAPRD